MSDKNDYWKIWSEKAMRYALGERSEKTNKKTTLWTLETWFGQLPAAIAHMLRDWFKR